MITWIYMAVMLLVSDFRQLRIQIYHDYVQDLYYGSVNMFRQKWINKKQERPVGDGVFYTVRAEAM
jgi:hypothetical protein